MSIAASLTGSVASLPTAVPGTNGMPMPAPNIVGPLLSTVGTTTPQPVPQPVMMPSRGPPQASAASAPAPAVASNVPPSAPPPSLIANMPDPDDVRRQKDQHLRTLDSQLKEGLEKLDTQIKEKRKMMLAQAEKQKIDFGLKVDAEVKMQELDLDKQFLSVVQYVKQEATRQRAMLEQQAMQLSFQYQEKKVEEDMLAQQFELHKQQHAIQETIQRQPPVTPLKSLVPLPVPMPAHSTSQVGNSPMPSVVPTPTVEAVPSYSLPASTVEVRELRTNSYMPPVAAPQVYTSSSYVPQIVNGTEILTAPTTYVAAPPSIGASPAASELMVVQVPTTMATTPITPARVISTTPLPTTTVLEPQGLRGLKTMTLTSTSAKTLSVSESKARMAAPDYAAGSS
mmetsp:Transcript_128719/g.227817  ORF Transcript_128719/g.227817 Transcript_128719/m.227817 type:complete len:397 (-) Transcript_128719:49-1239(-)